MVNLLVKAAGTITEKKITFPKLKDTDSSTSICRKMTTYLSKVRAVEHQTFSIDDLVAMVPSETEKVTINFRRFNDVDTNVQEALQKLICYSTTFDGGQEEFEEITDKIVVMVYSPKPDSGMRELKPTYFAIFDDVLFKSKSKQDMQRYNFGHLNTVSYAVVSFSFFSLVTDSDYPVDKYASAAWYISLEISEYIKQNYDIAKATALNTAYCRMTHKQIATICDNKIYQDDELNRTTSFNQLGFCKSEIDTEYYQGLKFDYNLFRLVESDWESLCNRVPHSTIEPELKVRKLGKHHATGLYVPMLNILAIDVRDSSSFIHEYGHYLDDTYGREEGMISNNSRAFAKIRSMYATNLLDCAMGTNEYSHIIKSWDYYTTPTEIFARAFELWVHYTIDGDTCLTKQTETYNNLAVYQAFKPICQQVFDYFDELFKDFKDIQPVYTVKQSEPMTYHLVFKDVEPTNIGEQLSLFDF